MGEEFSYWKSYIVVRGIYAELMNVFYLVFLLHAGNYFVEDI